MTTGDAAKVDPNDPYLVFLYPIEDRGAIPDRAALREIDFELINFGICSHPKAKTSFVEIAIAILMP
jgi:hypothetical protein